VIIPTLNEEGYIERCIHNVLALDPDVEIIVADGGSKDNTLKIAYDLGVIVVDSRPSRGTQLNSGAERASGDVLLFLHADTELPEDTFKYLEELFQNREVQIGTFKIVYNPHHWLLDLISFFMRFDTIFTKFGDQCTVVRRIFFDSIGGFPDWPLFEDVGIFQTARKRTRIHSFPGKAITSSRRFIEKGALLQLLTIAWYLVLYLTGTSPEELARRYNS
jgi:rSAM/selenodomain-associated transferase 2